MLGLSTISARNFSRSATMAQIKRVTVIGGGAMGSGIAQVCMRPAAPLHRRKIMIRFTLERKTRMLMKKNFLFLGRSPHKQDSKLQSLTRNRSCSTNPSRGFKARCREW